MIRVYAAIKMTGSRGGCAAWIFDPASLPFPSPQLLTGIHDTGFVYEASNAELMTECFRAVRLQIGPRAECTIVSGTGPNRAVLKETEIANQHVYRKDYGPLTRACQKHADAIVQAFSQFSTEPDPSA